MDFKEGDIVVLKSGGPEMTIENIGPLNFYSKIIGAHCCWFNANDLKRDVFTFDVLKKIEK